MSVFTGTTGTELSLPLLRDLLRNRTPSQLYLNPLLQRNIAFDNMTLQMEDAQQTHHAVQYGEESSHIPQSTTNVLMSNQNNEDSLKRECDDRNSKVDSSLVSAIRSIRNLSFDQTHNSFPFLSQIPFSLLPYSSK
jgi:hypothetical protein